MGRNKKYKVGDRIFYEDYDGDIDTSIVIDIKDESYINRNGKEIHYQWLVLWRDGNCSAGIEDYNCISPSNPKCKDFASQFAEFDKNKDDIIKSIIKIISPWGKNIQKEILETLKLKLFSE